MTNTLGVRAISTHSMRRLRVFAFLAVEAALYSAFLYGDLFCGGADTAPLKYAGIALCFLTALLGAAWGGERLMALGLALTLGADTFLLLLDRWYLAGVLFFFGVQLVYWARLARAGGRLWLAARGGLTALLLLMLAGFEFLTPLTAAAAVYLAQFLGNVAQSFRLGTKWSRLFFWGLLLYLACDVCVGAYNLPWLVPERFYSFSRIGMWLFYLPGQVLLVLSGLTEWRDEEDANQGK